MNSLSWLIYFSDVALSLNFYLGTVGVIAIVAAFLCFMFGAIFNDGRTFGILPQCKKTGTWLSVLAATSLLVSVPIPSQKTILMIATSESAGHLAQTEEAKSLRKIINQKLNEIILNEAQKEPKK